jgi:hypothetical protein
MIRQPHPATPPSMAGVAARLARAPAFADAAPSSPRESPSEGRLGAWADSSAVLVAGADVTEFNDTDGAALMLEFFAARA